MPRAATERKPPPSRRLEWIALGLALALVICRGTMQEFLREPFEVMPGSDPVPRSAGPAASIGLDLLCCIPALLALVRRVSDKTFSLRSPRSFTPLALLCLWMLASTFWAADKFGALVTACHWTAGMAILWAASQLVRDWLRLRLVAAVAFGLLPVYVIYGINYRFLELPDVQKTFRENRERMLKEHGLQEGTFAAKQFVDKVNLGEMFGFLTSPNSFGALLSLLLVTGAGLLIQRVRDEKSAPLPIQAGAKRQRSPGSDGARTHIPPATATLILVMLLGIWIMAYTRSRTAFATPVLAAILLLLIWRFHDAMARRAKAYYFVGIALLIAVAVAVVARGVTRRNLFHSSLTFRWQYWVGSLGIFRERPLTGVGWNNFGFYYLAHRLPAAPEEIKDPHDFIVRFFTELGVVGGILLIAWQLRLWCELTRPAWPITSEADPSAPGVMKFVAAIAAGGIVLSTLLAVDFSLGAPELDVMRRLLWLGAIIIVSSLVALRSLHSQEPDARPAPWVLYSIIVGAGVFLVHNLIDFSLFEIGPMFLFAILIGSALGVRQSAEEPIQPRSSKAPAIALTAGIIAWLAAGLLLWGPLLTAQRKSDAADDAIRADRSERAASLLVEANADAWRLNGDYAFGAARVSPPEKAIPLLDEAIRENARDLSYFVSRARAELQRPAPNRGSVRSDYESARAIDPNNVALRLDYARTLASFGDRGAALKQYGEALRYNAKLNPDEKKRLTAQQLDEIAGEMRKLEK